MVSHQHQCIFIHIPKAAGTSIEKKLGLFEEVTRDTQDHRTLAELQPLGLQDLKQPFRYQTAYTFYRKLIARKEGRLGVTQKQYNDYFKFSFIRNPWARVFSWYKNVMADPQHQKTYGVSVDCSFDQFVEQHLEDWPLKSQLYWLKDRQGQLPYDYIGKFENLENDAAKIFGFLGLDPSLPRLNMGTGESYHSYYNASTIKKVAEKYAEEIELFGYAFQESGVPKPFSLPSRLSPNQHRFYNSLEENSS
jgi:Sulfotransferase family